MSSCDSSMSEVGDNATAVAVSPGLSGLTSFIDAVLAPAPEAEHEPAPPPATKGSPRSRLRELQAEITKELAANNEAFGTKDWQDQLLTVLESRDYWKDQYERYRRKYEALRAKYVFVVERHNSLVTANLRTRDQLQDLERELFKSVLPDGLQASSVHLSLYVAYP